MEENTSSETFFTTTNFYQVESVQKSILLIELGATNRVCKGKFICT